MNGRSSLLANASLFELSPHHVDEGERIGFLHEDKAAALGRLMAIDGQRDPIKVVAIPGNADRPWRLVTGMHRLIGARIEGLTVHAIEVSGNPEDMADLEASENLHRRPLGPIERAKFTAALVLAAQERLAREHGDLTQQKLAVKARWDRVKSGELRAEQALKDEAEDTCATVARVYGWEETVGEALDMSRRTIHRDLSLFRLLIEPFPDLIADLAAHPVVGENAAQLKTLAAVKDEGARRRVIERLLADPEMSADDARIHAGIDVQGAATPVAYQKFYNQIEGGWSRLSNQERTAFVPTLATMLHTPGLKRTMRDRLSEELGDNDPSLKSALSAAFGVISNLATGEAVDDDQIEAARRVVQDALMRANSLIPGKAD